MTDIVFPSQCYSAQELCGSDPEALKCFRDVHRNLRSTSLPSSQPYLVSLPASRESLSLYHQVRATTGAYHSRIAHFSEQYGAYALPLAEFYTERLLPIQNELLRYTRENAIGLVNAALETPGQRAEGFAGAIRAYQDTLLKVRRAKLDKLPGPEQARLAQQARTACEHMNRRFRAELEYYKGRWAHASRGSALSNPQRALNQARDARTPKPITFSDSHQVMRLTRFAHVARIAGRGLLVLDVGLRTQKVVEDPEAGADWQRTATIETVGLSFGFLSGYGASYAVAGGLGLLLGATPVGWVIMIAGGITAGYLAGSQMDRKAKEFASQIYDRTGPFAGH